MDDQDLNEYFLDGLNELLGPEEITVLITSFIVLIVYFVLAIYSTKLARNTSIPGARVIAWSCWILAFSWFPLFLITWDEKYSDDVALFIASDLIATTAMVTGAYGSSRLVLALLKKKSEKDI